MSDSDSDVASGSDHEYDYSCSDDESPPIKKALDPAFTAMLRKLEEMEVEKNLLNNQVASLHAQVKSIPKTADAHSATLDAQRELLAKRNAEISEKEAENSKLQSKVHSLQKTLVARDREIATLVSKTGTTTDAKARKEVLSGTWRKGTFDKSPGGYLQVEAMEAAMIFLQNHPDKVKGRFEFTPEEFINDSVGGRQHDPRAKFVVPFVLFDPMNTHGDKQSHDPIYSWARHKCWICKKNNLTFGKWSPNGPKVLHTLTGPKFFIARQYRCNKCNKEWMADSKEIMERIYPQELVDEFPFQWTKELVFEKSFVISAAFSQLQRQSVRGFREVLQQNYGSDFYRRTESFLNCKLMHPKPTKPLRETVKEPTDTGRGKKHRQPTLDETKKAGDTKKRHQPTLDELKAFKERKEAVTVDIESTEAFQSFDFSRHPLWTPPSEETISLVIHEWRDIRLPHWEAHMTETKGEAMRSDSTWSAAHLCNWDSEANAIFSSLHSVMNEWGQICSSVLVKDDSNLSLDPQMTEFKNRFDQKELPKVWWIDNCCHLRKWFKEHFVSVKEFLLILDAMHFNARWDDVFPSDDKKGRSLIVALKLCIWEHEKGVDKNKHLNNCAPWEKRIPKGSVIEKKINDVLAKWAKISPSHVNNRKFQDVLRKQRHHIQNDCLTDPKRYLAVEAHKKKDWRVIRGTSQLEAFHAALRRIMGTGKLSIQTCHELLHMFTYEWNVKQAVKFFDITMPELLDPVVISRMKHKYTRLFGSTNNPFMKMPIPEKLLDKPAHFFASYSHNSDLPAPPCTNDGRTYKKAQDTCVQQTAKLWKSWFPEAPAHASGYTATWTDIFEEKNASDLITEAQIAARLRSWGLEIDESDPQWRNVIADDIEQEDSDDDDEETKKPRPLLEVFSLLTPEFSPAKIQEFDSWVMSKCVPAFNDMKDHRRAIRDALQCGGKLDVIKLLRVLRFFAEFADRSLLIFVGEPKPYLFYPTTYRQEKSIKAPLCVWWDPKRQWSPIPLTFSDAPGQPVEIPPTTQLTEVPKAVAQVLHQIPQRTRREQQPSSSPETAAPVIPTYPQPTESTSSHGSRHSVTLTDIDDYRKAEGTTSEEAFNQLMGIAESAEGDGDEIDGDESPQQMPAEAEPEGGERKEEEKKEMKKQPERKTATRAPKTAATKKRKEVATAVGHSGKTINQRSDDLLVEVAVFVPRRQGVSFQFDYPAIIAEYNARVQKLNDEHAEDGKWVKLPLRTNAQLDSMRTKLHRLRSGHQKLLDRDRELQAEADAAAKAEEEKAAKEEEDTDEGEEEGDEEEEDGDSSDEGSASDVSQPPAKKRRQEPQQRRGKQSSTLQRKTYSKSMKSSKKSKK